MSIRTPPHACRAAAQVAEVHGAGRWPLGSGQDEEAFEERS